MNKVKKPVFNVISEDFKLAQNEGFTLIELMIVIAIIAIILTLALPVYSNYLVRTKIGEALSVAAAAKTAVAATCLEDPTLDPLSPSGAGYLFDSQTPYIDSIDIQGNCATPVIRIVTRNTGLTPDPIINLTGNFSNNSRVTWNCVSDSPNHYFPPTCRS